MPMPSPLFHLLKPQKGEITQSEKKGARETLLFEELGQGPMWTVIDHRGAGKSLTLLRI